MPVKEKDILKHILLNEVETENLPQGFEDDPMGFILKKYPGLNSVMEYMMTESFREYVDAVFIVAPKPTTFKIMLHNGQFFFLQFMGKAYQATVQGKNYYLMSIGEKERCMLAIARLLRYGNPLSTKGPEGAEQGTRPEGETGGEGEEAGGGGGEAAPPPPETGGEEGGEETVTESRILEEILKKTLSNEAKDINDPFFLNLRSKQEKKKSTEEEDFEEENFEEEDDTKKYEKIIAKNINDQISEIKKSLPGEDENKSIIIKIKGIPYSNIKEAVVVPGTLNKSDINLLDSKGTPVIFISHKDEGGPKRFARWGSFQYLYSEGKNTEINNFRKNIYTFVSQKTNKEGDEKIKYANIEKGKLIFYKKAAFSQKISSDDLKKKLVFGRDFGEEPGLNNVQLVVQGNLVLKKLGEEIGVYEFDLEKSENVWFNGELPTGQYEPVLHVHYRGKVHNELDIKNCETMARPIAAISKPEQIRSLWEPNQILDPDLEIPKHKVEIDKKDSIPLNKGGRAASEDWIDKHKEYSNYFNRKAAPIKFPGKEGVFYTLKPDSEIELVKKED